MVQKSLLDQWLQLRLLCKSFEHTLVPMAYSPTG
jgi:hypothetical protein